MAFSLPNFNLLCDVYTGPWLAKVLRISDVPCNLALGRRVQQPGATFTTFEFGAAAPSVLLPPRTDVRDFSCVTGYDVLEVPKGTGRWYAVMQVDDVGRGFANEYRIAFPVKAVQAVDATEFAGSFWPTPIP